MKGSNVAVWPRLLNFAFCFAFCAGLIVLPVNALALKPSEPRLDETRVLPASIAPRENWSFMEAGLIPLQAGGRIKPLESFAAESVLFLTGSRSWKGWNHVDFVFSVMAYPEHWQKEPIIKVNHPDLRRQLLLDESRNRYSPEELFHNSALLQYARKMEGGQEELMDPRGAMGQQSSRERELKKVLHRLTLFRALVSGEAWTIVPASGQGDEAWLSLATNDPRGMGRVRESFAQLVRAYYEEKQDLFERQAVLTRGVVEGEIEGWGDSDRRKLYLESVYGRWRPFRLAFLLFLVSGILWSFAILRTGSRTGKATAPRLSKVAMGLTLLGLAVQILGFGLRVWISGRAPVSNMYETVIWVAFGTIAFALIIYYVQKQKQADLMAAATIVAAFTLLAADAAPAILDPTIQPLVPVLRSNFWLTVHVLTITAGYAAFALALGLANVTLWHYFGYRGPKETPEKQRKINNTNQLMYRAIQIGVVLLAAGTILGGVWADYSWGRFWGWDPKETWALIALLTYIAVLHGRYAAWVGQFGFAAWSVVSFLSVVMAWYGVNFVLGAGLHSYGFASGGTGWVVGFSLLQLAYVGAAALTYRKIGIPKKKTAKDAKPGSLSSGPSPAER